MLKEKSSIKKRGIQMLFGIRTTIGQEKIVADLLQTKMKREGYEVHCIMIIDTLRGYMLIEAPNQTEVKKLIYKVPHVRGLVRGEMGMKEVEHFLEVKPLTAGIERGSIVELTSGAFKGEKAKVIRVDEGKDKITVEIIESAVPIPITVNASNVRIVTQTDEVK
ncbi:MAG: transcription elongation factor Spt5 [Candidatus Micrarchaeota archaeon]